MSPAGAEIGVGVTATFQGAPAVAGDALGDFVVAWQRQNPTTGGWDTFARQYNRSGTATGPEFQVNTTTGAGCRQAPAVAADGAGNFVVVWQSDEEPGGLHGIFAQAYGSSGQAWGGQFQVNTTLTTDEEQPAVAMGPADHLLVVWASNGGDSSSWGVVGREVAMSSAGIAATSAEIAVNQTTAGAQHAPAAAFSAGAGTQGGYVVAWQSEGQDGTGGGTGASGILARLFDPSSGAALGGEIAVNAPQTGSHGNPRVATDPSGNFAVAWEDLMAAGSLVLVRRFRASGAALSGQLQVDASPTGAEHDPAVASDLLGNFVVVWDSQGQDGSGTAVLAEQLSNQEAVLGGKIQLNTTTAGDQGFPVVAQSSGGDVFAAWQSVTPAADGSVVTALLASVPALRYYSVMPCRLVDTRSPAGPRGGPSLSNNVPRNFPVTGVCGVPATAKALSINVTVVNPASSGFVSVYPGDAPQPATSSINFASAGEILANNAVVSLARDGDGSLNALAGIAGSPGTTDLIVDVNGYFQ